MRKCRENQRKRQRNQRKYLLTLYLLINKLNLSIMCVKDIIAKKKTLIIET